MTLQNILNNEAENQDVKEIARKIGLLKTRPGNHQSLIQRIIKLLLQLKKEASKEIHLNKIKDAWIKDEEKIEAKEKIELAFAALKNNVTPEEHLQKLKENFKSLHLLQQQHNITSETITAKTKEEFKAVLIEEGIVKQVKDNKGQPILHKIAGIAGVCITGATNKKHLKKLWNNVNEFLLGNNLDVYINPETNGASLPKLKLTRGVASSGKPDTILVYSETSLSDEQKNDIKDCISDGNIEFHLAPQFNLTSDASIKSIATTKLLNITAISPQQQLTQPKNRTKNTTPQHTAPSPLATTPKPHRY